MISKTTMMVGILAVLVAFIAAYGVRSYLAMEEEVPPPPGKVAAPELLRLPLASMDLPADRVTASHDVVELSMTITEFKKRFPEVNLENVLGSPRSVINRRLKKSVKQGHPFSTTDFYLEGTDPTIASKLQPGYRAIRVQVPNTREAGVRSGMYVDVFFRANPRPAKAGQPAIPEKTLTLLQHIEVLEAERPGGPEAPKGKPGQARVKPLLFTLAVPEEKADMFGVIAGRGELWLVPTPAKEQENAKGAGTEVANAETLAELLGIKPLQPASPPFETEIYERGRRTVNTFIDGKLVTNRRSALYSGMMSDERTPSSPVAAPPAPEINTVPTAPPAPEKD